MSLINYEPVNFLNRMQHDLDNFLKLNGHSIFHRSPDESDTFIPTEWIPTVNIDEEEKQFVITADVPGVSPEDIEVSMDGHILSIKGERKHEQEETKKNYRLRECSYGSFERRLSMPDTADETKIKAKNKDGVLTVTIAKKKASKSKLIKVES